MTGTDADTVLEPLSDADCRAILCLLDEPHTAKEVTASCDLPRTSAYRKLTALSEAGLVEERTRVRTDGNHVTAYVRDCAGVFVSVDEGSESVSVDVVREPESPDERLERLWARIGEEL
ncbi:helix-turn-helix domain-containing protein [Halobium salinum]|uniref:Helix-turn-helix domain-containing protein n=1 Tax=Halobium salinum TaxID=1364940 RepID=A0ABD5P9N3_9EURY|nr:helix-turn-helix domain-containing protein [Halobium salinum]